MSDKQRIGELEDQIKRKDERIAELRDEIDELRDLTSRLREHAEDYVNCLESWKETFGMVMTDDGKWTWEPFWDERDKLIDDYNKMVRDWNRHVVPPRNVGRPLAASDAQVTQVRKLHKAGRSLRWIMEETSLGFQTVRTIVGQVDGTDGTSQRHMGRIDPDRLRQARWKRQRRTGDALPRRVQRVIEDGHALAKEARGR